MVTRFIRSVFLLLLVIFVPSLTSARAQDLAKEFPAFDGKQAFDYSQSAIGHPVGDYVFLDSNGTKRHLSEFFGKPIVISLIYTSCYHTCPMITNNLIRTIEGSGDILNLSDYVILTIGFDTAVDTPRRMRQYANERGIQAPNWYLLSTDDNTIKKLSADLGFIFYPSPKGFDHLAQTTILTPDGMVFQHVYTPNFEAPFLVEPLKELIYGNGPRTFQMAGFTEQLKLFCTFYDPKTGRYRFDYSLFVAIIVGSLSLLGVGIFLIREWFFRPRA